MGGMGFIEHNKALCMLNVLNTTHMLLAANELGVPRFFYASSACVYNADKQADPNVTALKEEDAYPALPEDGYGWEKLFTERMARHFYEDFGLEARVARFHNVYGKNGTYDGGREKAPAALCRKVAEAQPGGSVEIWGDGEQTRSFCYVDDCVEGIYRIMQSDYSEPINLGTDRMVTINELAAMLIDMTGSSSTIVHIPYDEAYERGFEDMPRRLPDISKVTRLTGWRPSRSLDQTLADVIEHERQLLERPLAVPEASL